VVAVFAYDPTDWHDLFLAGAGAGAALAGLVFVAVSINIDRILKFSGLPERALQTVLLLLAVVVISIIGLIPGQDHHALGIELLIASLSFSVVIWMTALRAMPTGKEPRMWLTERLVILTWGTLPFVIGGLSVFLANGAGLYWIVLGMVGAIVGAVANAWVLLVEILR
jgi:hypothetical protein